MLSSFVLRCAENKEITMFVEIVLIAVAISIGFIPLYLLLADVW